MQDRLRSFLSSLQLQRRSFGIVFFVIGVLLLSHLAELALLTYYNNNWDRIVESKSNAQLAVVTTEFTNVQRRTRRIAAELARHADVTGYLTGKAADEEALFDAVARIARNQDVGAEVYDRTARLIAWHGRSGTVNEREVRIALEGVLTSYVTRGPIFSQLFVITPVRVDGSVVGAVLIRQAIEVNYPLSNKFIRRAGLAEQLSRDLGVTVDITFGGDAEPRKDGRYVSTELKGIDGRKLGVASILRLGRATYLETVSNRFQMANDVLILILILVGSVYVTQFFGRIRSPFWKCVSATFLVWLVRYILLWADIPSVLVHAGIFDPAFFASKFGGGLAKSIGELTLTSLALFTNTALVVAILGTPALHRRPARPFPLAASLIAGAAITTLMFLLLRGYAATIRSAVMDSTLRFNDPKVIIPSFELGLMVFNLFVISFCLIVVSVALTRLILFLFERGRHTGWLPWAATFLLFVLASFLFDVYQETPLMSAGFRLLFGVAMLLFARRILRRTGRRTSPATFMNAVIVLAFCALLTYPLLDDVIHEKDRDRVEIFARDALRPADAWFTFVVNDALHGFASDNTFDVLLYGNREEVERLAFTAWAQSTAAQRGYTCSFSIVDSSGKELSHFAIGEQNPMMTAAALSVLRNHATNVEVRDVGSGVNSLKLYAGSIPIRAMDRLLGYGVVVVSASQQSLFRGGTPSVFRTASQENIESFYRPITVSEFRNGIPEGDASLPIGYTMPDEVVGHFRNTPATSMWVDETIGGKEYETLFVRRTPASQRVIALRMETIGLQWHLFGIVRMLVYFAMVLTGAVILLLLVRWALGDPYRLTFRDKLLVSLLIISAVPVIAISNYTRMFMRDRAMDEMAQQLERETEMVEEGLLRQHTPDSLAVLHSDASSAERLAARMKTDFNLYVGDMLRVSSRPELYDSGILDRRLSGSAYEQIFVLGQRFYVETENIGSFRYAVGYRPLLDDQGKAFGVISVPTLYRQDDIEADVAKSNAVLFGIAGVIFLLITIVAITLANRIASPIHKLTEATKRVSLGDLDVKVNARADGEVQELINAFESMTRDLKRSRENLVQYERELAWKEMAKQVAHEIKNPLTPMKLALQHLRQTYRDKAENFDEIFEEVSQMVIRQVDALSRIASEFSSFARMPTAKLEECSVNDILRETVSLFEQDRNVTFDVTLAPYLPSIMADREELRRAFINIIRNGIQAMDNSGRMEVHSAYKDQNIEVRIRDYGTGIPDDIREKLFQPNFSTKTDGMGLGLAIVKKTIEDLNGSIGIESELNAGTTVIIHIPHNGAPHD